MAAHSRHAADVVVVLRVITDVDRLGEPFLLRLRFYREGLVVGNSLLEASNCLSKYGKGVRRERLSCNEMAENTASASGLQCEMATN